MTDDEAAELAKLQRRYSGVVPVPPESPLSPVEWELEAIEQRLKGDFPVKPVPDNVLPFEHPDSVTPEDPK